MDSLNIEHFFFYNGDAHSILDAFIKQSERRIRRQYGRRARNIDIPEISIFDTDTIKDQLIDLMSQSGWQQIEVRLQNLSSDRNNIVSIAANRAVLRQNNFVFPVEIWDEVLASVLSEIELVENPIDLFSAFDDDIIDETTSYNPNFSPKSGIRFYGLEIEFNSSDKFNQIKDFLSDNKLGKIVTDSSCGYEMVSAPWEYQDMVNYIDNLPLSGVKIDNRCGIHIHVSRDIFTPLMLGRLMVFINDPDNQDYIIKKVGRSANRYCQIENKGKDPNQVKLESTTRYEAINLTNYGEDKYTIEFRMFASTTNKQVIKGYLKWLDAMITLSETNNLSIELIENAINS